MAIARTRN